MNSGTSYPGPCRFGRGQSNDKLEFLGSSIVFALKKVKKREKRGFGGGGVKRVKKGQKRGFWGGGQKTPAKIGHFFGG